MNLWNNLIADAQSWASADPFTAYVVMVIVLMAVCHKLKDMI